MKIMELVASVLPFVQTLLLGMSLIALAAAINKWMDDEPTYRTTNRLIACSVCIVAATGTVSPFVTLPLATGATMVAIMLLRRSMGESWKSKRPGGDPGP